MPTKISPVGSSASSGGSGGGTIGGLVTDGTAGSVLFVGAAGVLAQDNARFFYDDTNNQLQLSAGAVGNTPLKITLFAAQTADAFQVFASDGTTELASVTPTGGFASYGAVLLVNNNNGSASIGNVGIAYNDIFCAIGTRRYVGANAVDGVTAGQLGVVSTAKIGFFASSTDPVTGTMDSAFARIAAGIIKVSNGSTGGGALEFLEQTAPSAATANSVRIYAQDNGAGKTQLMALFATGAAQQIAIEP